ncbi:MAG: hypothetical protein B6U89_07240 [Desulfurococcales archaeon ex4484_58]|nr:MAG: hypothetical protein B6U89_07240 [Desulfurococcales archaeon ex4484_58]
MKKNVNNDGLYSIVYRREPLGKKCRCDVLLDGFLWRELVEIDPSELPRNPGVYVIRVFEYGDPIDELIRGFKSFISKTRWIELSRYVESRLKRLYRIGECPLIYIGSANSIRSRYLDLAGKRHTIFFPVLILLYGGWKLDYGFKTTQNKDEAEMLEEELKNKYKSIHGTLPALVEK